MGWSDICDVWHTGEAPRDDVVPPRDARLDDTGEGRLAEAYEGHWLHPGPPAIGLGGEYHGRVLGEDHLRHGQVLRVHDHAEAQVRDVPVHREDDLDDVPEYPCVRHGEDIVEH